MNIENKIIIHASPQDVSVAILKNTDVPKGYELKEFSYTLKKIKDMPNIEEFNITSCKLILEKTS